MRMHLLYCTLILHQTRVREKSLKRASLRSMNHSSHLLMTLQTLLLLLLMDFGIGHQNECRQLFCDPIEGPLIRCPFQLMDGITNRSGFRLSCTENNKTMLDLPAVPVKLIVNYISYEDQTLSVSDPENCLPRIFLKIYNSSLYPFRFESQELKEQTNITFFDCSSVGQQTSSDAQDMVSCPTYVADSDESVIGLDQTISCTKLFDLVSPVPAYSLVDYSQLTLTWSKQDLDTRCSDCKHEKSRKMLTSIILEAAGSILVVAVVLYALFQIYRYFRMKGEDHARVENFLKDYRALKPTRFSYADVKRITHQFKDKLGEGAHGAVFKGKLSSDILVAVKILNNTEGDGKEFINEVGTMGKIHHVNVVRLLGFCADGFHRALVYDFFPNGSLQNFISLPNNTDTSFLGWDKLQQIALGIAKGIEYLHQGCEQRILHFDINPHNVLLDDSFTPKISDFGLAKLCSKNKSNVSMTAARGTLGYMAPEVFSRNFGNISYKSDIYSYGMLLLEMVGGRKNINTGHETSQILYPEWIHNLLEGGDIHISIDEEEDLRIAKKLAVAGLWCIQWHPVHRPSMKSVVQMLQGEGDKLKVPPNPFESSASTNTSVIIPSRRLNLEQLEVIEELE